MKTNIGVFIWCVIIWNKSWVSLFLTLGARSFENLINTLRKFLRSVKIWVFRRYFSTIFWIVGQRLILIRTLEILIYRYLIRLALSNLDFCLFLEFKLNLITGILIKTIKKFLIGLGLPPFLQVRKSLVLSHWSSNTIPLLSFWNLSFFFIVKNVVDHVTNYWLCSFQIVTPSHISRVFPGFKIDDLSWCCG